MRPAQIDRGLLVQSALDTRSDVAILRAEVTESDSLGFKSQGNDAAYDAVVAAMSDRVGVRSC